MRFLTSLFVVFSTLPSIAAPVTLLPHQQAPIDYLVKHDNVHGLVVNHFMGTGKTYLGIGFAERYQEKRVVILAPRFIESHWQQHLRDFPVKDAKRYEFVSYNDAPCLLKQDLTNTILLLDEVHNLIRLIKSADPSTNRVYSDLYVHLRGAHKILALSGTPIYNDEYDFAYLTNLVSGEDLMPFNEEQFRIGFTKIKKLKSFWRGYVFESNLLKNALPMGVAAASIPLYVVGGTPLGLPVTLGGAVGSALVFPVVTNWIAPIETSPLRFLDAQKFQPYISKYVSFYEIADLDMSEFPSTTIHNQDVAYNPEQFWFFLNFTEKSLGNRGLARMYKDINSDFDQAYLTLNTTVLQNRLADTIGSGREIGNFDFEAEGSRVEAPKFVEVLAKMRSAGMPKTVVYSNYFENGTLAFARFLDRHGLKDSYAILRPDLSPDAFAEVTRSYNENRVKILLLHPEITEGISLKGTRHFHILEPVTNLTVQNQVTARAVRYQSHSALPASERHVDIFIWKAVIGSGSMKTLKLQKANWFKRYSEMSDWSNFGQGITQVDKNFDRKRLSPDSQAFMRLQSVNQNIDALKNIMRDESIEKKGAQAALVAIEPWTGRADDEEGLDLDPVMLPKTNIKAIWHTGQQLLIGGDRYKLSDSMGFNVEFEVPLHENFSTGFYIEDYWGQKAEVKGENALDSLGAGLREFGQNVLGLGGFVKGQIRLPSSLGHGALSVRVPFGGEFLLGKSLVPLGDVGNEEAILRSVVSNPLSGMFGYGLTTGATLGLEYYPMEFVGLSMEGGYRVAYHTYPTTVPGSFLNPNESKFDGFRAYMIHGWTLSGGVKLTY